MKATHRCDRSPVGGALKNEVKLQWVEDRSRDASALWYMSIEEKPRAAY